MPGYRAKFIGGLRVKPDTKITLTLCVNMNCVQQTGEQFAAFSGLVIKHRAKITDLQIIVSDDLYRHYNGWTPDTSDADRKAMADATYAKWMEKDLKYLSFFHDAEGIFENREKICIDTEDQANTIFGLSLAELRQAQTISFKIKRWRELAETPEYLSAKEQVDRAFETDSKFKQIVTEVAKSHIAKKGYSLEAAIEFLKEEIAATAGPLKNTEIAYPSPSLNPAIMCALRDIFHEDVAYHGYTVEQRSKTATTMPVEAPPIVGISDEKLQIFLQMLAVAAKTSMARAAEIEVGGMRFRFEYARHRNCGRSKSPEFGVSTIPEPDVLEKEPLPASSPK